MNCKALLEDLKPLCISIVKDPTVENIQSLDKFLDAIIEKELNKSESVSILNDLKEYASFPLLLILKNKDLKVKRLDDLLESVLKCLKTILSNISFVSWNYFKDVFQLLIDQITSFENVQKVKNVSEEIKMEVLENLIFLCKTVSPSLSHQYSSQVFRPQLGHAIHICLQISIQEKNRELKVLALRTIEELGLKSQQTLYDAKSINELTHTLAYFLPGVCSKTARLATANEVQGHKLIVAAIECFQYFLHVVMRDKFISSIIDTKSLFISKSETELRAKIFPSEVENKDLGFGVHVNGEDYSKPPKEAGNSSSNSPLLKEIKLDKAWVMVSSQQLTLLLSSSLPALVTNSHWRVRQAVVSLCKCVLENCQGSMEPCLVTCMETVIGLKGDPVEEVVINVQECLSSFQSCLSSDANEHLMESLEDRVFSLATQIPSMARTQDDVRILSSLRQLQGILEILGDRVTNLLRIPSHIQRILRSFVILLSFDYSNGDLLAEISYFDSLTEVALLKPRLPYSFRYFNSEAILNCVASCCTSLGRSSSLVVDSCLDFLQETRENRGEVTYLLCMVLASSHLAALTDLDKEILVQSIIDVLMDLRIFDAPIAAPSTKCSETNDHSLVALSSFQSSVPSDLAKKNVILISNCLRVIGLCATALLKNFNVFLNKILCCVLEKAGDSNAFVSNSALIALDEIASAMDYNSIPSLIEGSVMFFWFPLSQKLKRLTDYPTAPQVLRVVLKYCGGEVKIFVQELIEDVLESLDHFHVVSALPLLMVILSFVETVNSVDTLTVNQACSAIEEISTDNCADESKERILLSFLNEINETQKKLDRELIEETHNDMKEFSSLSKEDFTNMSNDADEELDEETEFKCENNKEVPKKIELFALIMERCSYLLFMQDRRIQLAVLQIISNCCYLLNEWEDKKLPCYHKIWQPLIMRLKSQDYAVFLKSLETCLLMVKTSGTFLKRRFLTELLPPLSQFLHSQSITSQAKGSYQAGYHHTPSYKAQRNILLSIPEILCRLQLDVPEANDLLNGVIIYLDVQQPQELQQLAMRATEAFALYHSDLVWLSLASRIGLFRINAPSNLLPVIQIRGKHYDYLSEEALQFYRQL